ncbi:MAG: hypothetical protein EA383_03480 [Spirochaetaceae bacterium]|nr:MAG: hypothetical protein EA383_03480 [Spirochaetaceae bacterium]
MNEYKARVRAYQKAVGQKSTGPKDSDEATASRKQNSEVPGVTANGESQPSAENRAGFFETAPWWQKGTSESTVPGSVASSHSSAESASETVSEGQTSLDREQAVAILLQSLEPDESARILRALPSDVSERVAARALTMEQPDDEQKREAFRLLQDIPGLAAIRTKAGEEGEFTVSAKSRSLHAQDAASGQRTATAPGWARAEDALTRAFGSEKAREIMSRAIPQIGRVWLSFLEELQPRQLSVLIGRESLEVKSLLVAHAAPQVGSRILAQAGRDEQNAMVRRVARMREVPSDIVRTIAESLKARMREIGTDAEREVQGVSTLAEIMKHLNDEHLLKEISDELPELGQALTDELYSIEMVHRVPDRALEDILNRLDDIEIARLLKGKEEAVRRRILENVSEHRALIISEEYRDLGPQLRKDVDVLTHEFVRMLREVEPDARTVSAQA